MDTPIPVYILLTTLNRQLGDQTDLGFGWEKGGMV